VLFLLALFQVKYKLSEKNNMVTSGMQLLSLEPSLTERAIRVAIALFSELNRGDSSSTSKAHKISKVFRLVLLPQESTLQVVNWKLYNWCLQISFNRINQAEIELVLPELENIWLDSWVSTKALSY